MAQVSVAIPAAGLRVEGGSHDGRHSEQICGIEEYATGRRERSRIWMRYSVRLLTNTEPY